MHGQNHIKILNKHSSALIVEKHKNLSQDNLCPRPNLKLVQDE